MPAVGRREELRGLGAELIRLDALVQSRRRGRYSCCWNHQFLRVGDRGLYDMATPFNDPVLLETLGERLLDAVIRLASEKQWKEWLLESVNVAALAGEPDLFLRIFSLCENSLGFWDTWMPNDPGRMLFYSTVRGGSVRILTALLAAGVGPYVREVDMEYRPVSALVLVAEHGHLGFVAPLVEAGAPLEYTWMLGGTALTAAVEAGSHGVALELLAAGADPNTIKDGTFPRETVFCPIDFPDYTPICIAASKNDERMVEILLEAGAALGEDRAAMQPLLMAARHGFCWHISRLLLGGASVRRVDPKGHSPLHVACGFIRLDAVVLLLKHNASVDALSDEGYSPTDVVGAYALQRKPPPATLTPEERDTVVKIRETLKHASAWGRRGWLVMLRRRRIVGNGILQADVKPERDGDAALSFEALSMVHDESLRDTAPTKRDEDDGLAVVCWTDAVKWMVQCPEDGVFSTIVQYI